MACGSFMSPQFKQSYKFNLENAVDRTILYDELAPLSTSFCMWIIKHGVGLNAVVNNRELMHTKLHVLVCLIAESLPTTSENYAQKHVLNAMKIVLDRCQGLLMEMRNLDEMTLKKGYYLCSEYFGVPEDVVLEYFRMHVFYSLASYYRMCKNNIQSNEYYMESFKIALKYKIRKDMDFVFLIIDYTTGILAKFEYKMFKQYHYLLNAAKAMMDEIPSNEENFRKLQKNMRYWFYSWIIYANQLLMQYKEHLSYNNFSTQKPNVRFESHYVGFDDVVIISQPIRMSDTAIQTNDDLKSLYLNLLQLKEKMYVWGPLQISRNMNSYKLIDQLLFQAIEIFPSLKN